MTIAAVTGSPTGIALSADSVYWAEQDKNTISSCPKTGCGAAGPTLVVSTPAPRGIALRGTTLYWVSAGSAVPPVAATIEKCTLGACTSPQIVDLQAGSGSGPLGSVGLAVSDLVHGPIFGLALDATKAYLGRGLGGLSTCPLAGCAVPADSCWRWRRA